MLPNIERLKVFYHVFSGKSVKAASKSLHISQSAVSQALQKLESEIKIPLFIRLHKKLVPTAAGERLFSTVGPFIADLDLCLKTLEKGKNQPFGELRIGAPMVFGKTYLPAIAAAFREQYQGVTFFLKFGDAGTLLPMVENGQIDFALVDEYLTQNSFFGDLGIYHFDPVIEEEIILACSKQYYEKSVKKDHSFKNLIGQSFITYRYNAQTIGNWFKYHFKKKVNVILQPVMVADNQQAIISAIQNHMGLGIVASHMIKEEIRTGQIIPIKISNIEIFNQISMVNLQDKIPTHTEKVFGKFMVEKIQSMDI